MVRKLLAAAIVVVLAGTAASAIWVYGALYRPLDNPERVVVIPEHATGSTVLALLHDTGLMPSPSAGRLYLELAARGRSFHFGQYRIPPDSRPVDTLERLLEGQVETTTVTIVEGLTAVEISQMFVAAGFGTPEEWRVIVSHGEWVHDVVPGATSLDGFLFPDTYRFAIGLSSTAVARHMVDRFRTVWAEESATASPVWGSPLDVVTLASLVEGETALSSERARIAGVFTNRLDRGMLLQCDPTVVYALKRRGEWTGRLLRRHWQTDDPYNTYRYPGLPPGPINSPGRAALAAALKPDTHSYLYFVASPEGGHTFSKSLREHERAVSRWIASRR